MNLNILCLYPNVMDLYGDNANIEILKYRAKQRKIDINVDTYTVGDEEPNFYGYDLVFLGGGSDAEQKVVAKDIIKYQKQIERSINKGIFYLLICGGFELFGKYYKDSENKVIKCLNIFNYYTEYASTKNEKCIGDIVIESVIDEQKIEVLGFENHNGQTFGIDTPFGKVKYGNGNTYKNEYEGFMKENVIATYLHGPLLSKNPELADYILKYCLERKYNKKVNLKELDDEFEIIAKKEMLDKLLTTSNI